MGDKHILQLEHITKEYPGVIALNDVSIDIKEGEVHALCGENGAGKSTLIKTCSGAISPTKGQIIVRDKAFDSMTPVLSAQNGIAVIYQEFNLVGSMTVAENIFLGRAIRNGILIDQKAMESETRKIFEQLGIDIAPGELVKNLTVGYQQMVEIGKAISQNAKVLIMDEPTAPLTKGETEYLMEMVEKLKSQGVTIIYISHRLDEVFRLSDRITVLRDGQKIITLNTSDTDVDELIKYMVGRELKEQFPERVESKTEEILLQVEGLTGNGDSDISFCIRKGEILGIAGLVGAGRTELAEMLFGVKQKTTGKIIFKGKEIAPKSCKEAIQHGIALVPEDRKRQGVLLSLGIRDNIAIPILKRISKVSFVSMKEEMDIANHYKEKMRIKTPTLNQLVKNLSGGNQQKVVVGKWLAANAELIILDEPTRGIDVGAKYEIYKLMQELLEDGKTIMLISSEMEELIGMSDRIIVLSEGRLTGELKKEEFSQELILSMASKIEGE